ncbi:MAG: SCP2 sterol-binding domain-containing protein [Holophagaceae bacterium]
MSIEKVFQRMPDLFRPDRAIGLTVTYLFICGQAENDTFQVSIADQTISIQKGHSKKPDVTIRVNADDWIAISENRLDGLKAYLEGKIKVEGSLALFQKFPKLFKPLHRRSSGRPLEEIIVRQVTNSREDIKIGPLKPSSLTLTGLWGSEDYLRPVLEGYCSPNALFLSGHLEWSGDAESINRFCNYCKLNPIKAPRLSLWRVTISFIKSKLRFI